MPATLDDITNYADPAFDPNRDFTPEERDEYLAYCREQDAWLEVERPRQLEAGELMPDGDPMPF
jgi:hypothetical protein